ncbi:MAG: hypothetical protein B7Z10_06475 [Rhodobacterales bacterium 32-66-7]|nr:MAG: hypothetical protein B7Z10_06475 [Rhodobacterales bacterium 32-66-7]
MDFSWSEIMVVGIVALILIGPKDLPGMFRELGRFTAKIRAMGRDFNRALESAAKDSGVKDVADDLRKMTNPKAMGLDAIKSAADKFDKWDPLKPATPKPAAPAPALGPGLATTPVTPPATPLGPATAALAETVQARKIAATERAAALAEAKAPSAPAPVEPSAVKRGGRTRKPASGAGDPAAKPAKVPAIKPTPKQGDSAP